MKMSKTKWDRELARKIDMTVELTAIEAQGNVSVMHIATALFGCENDSLDFSCYSTMGGGLYFVVRKIGGVELADNEYWDIEPKAIAHAFLYARDAFIQRHGEPKFGRGAQ